MKSICMLIWTLATYITHCTLRHVGNALEASGGQRPEPGPEARTGDNTAAKDTSIVMQRHDNVEREGVSFREQRAAVLNVI